jgi:hypothetical protein
VDEIFHDISQPNGRSRSVFAIHPLSSTNLRAAFHDELHAAFFDESMLAPFEELRREPAG